MELATARRLVELAGDRHIPVRCNIRGFSGKGGGEGHFGRGSLIGIEGNKLKVKPYRHGGKIEIYDCELVHVWTSRCVSNGVLTQEQIENAQQVSIMDKSNTNFMKSIEKKLTLESAICGVADTLSDQQGLPLSANIDRLTDIVNTSFKNEIVNKEEDTILEKKILASSTATSFVIADLNNSDNDNISIRFYMGKGSRRFTSAIEDAVIFSDAHAETNAKRSLGQIYHRPLMWKNVISNPKNLKVLTLEEAQNLCEKAAIQKKNRTLSPSPLPVESPAPQSVPEALPTVIETPKAPEPVVIVEEVPVVRVVETKTDLFADPAIQKALGEIQSSMANVQTAVDMLRDERSRLLKAQETLVSKVSQLVTGQLKVIDSSIVDGTSAIAGKRS